MNKHIDSYQVIEDNSGGLHLFTWAGDTMTHGMSNLEYLTPTDFETTLVYLESLEADTTELDRWDSLILSDPLAAYNALTANDLGWESIAVYFNGGKRITHPERMGAAGKLAFSIE